MNHDLTAALHRLADKINEKEATKQWIIEPFIEALGYDFNIIGEVIPEFKADVDLGLKNPDKVDYAITKDDKPIMIIECKGYGSDLEKSYKSQLYRYFGASDTQFGILTNGLEYHVFSDLDETNKMDLTPFLKFKLIHEDLNNKDFISSIQKLAKDGFDSSQLKDLGREIKTNNTIYDWFDQQSTDPSDSFVKLIIKENHLETRVGDREIKKYKPMVQKAFKKFYSEKFINTVKTLSDSESQPNEEPTNQQASKIDTTDEEKNAFHTIKAIIQKWTGPDRISYKDTQSYFAICLDDNIRKTICRLYLSSQTRKYIEIKSPEGEWERHDITTHHDLYGLEEVFKKSVESLS